MKHILTHTNARVAFLGSLAVFVFLLGVYMALEPKVSRSQVNSTFTVTQTIGDEISFLVEPADVTMVGTINGLTGGYATGTTFSVVRTNDPDGYNMTIVFSNATSMQGNTTSGFIDNYSPTATTVPDYNWTDDGTRGEFGYTVRASTSGEVDTFFLDNGTNCNTGSNETLNKCWLNPSTTAQQIINRSSEAPSGATTSLKFKVAVPSSPSPAIPADTYVATATLTATNNP